MTGLGARTTLIACPLRKEWAALADVFRAQGHELRTTDQDVATAPDLGVALAVAGHGKVDYAIHALHLLVSIGNVCDLVVAGVAGSLSSQVGPGSVVIGNETVEHDYKQRFSEGKPAPRFQASPVLVDAFTAAASRVPDVFTQVGPIASGDEDIVSTERSREVAEATGALCVAWEGAGGARVARFRNIQFMEIRAISDHADPDAAMHYKENLPTAMANLGRVLLSHLVR